MSLALFPSMVTEAILSDCKTYRYTLSRVWKEDKPVMTWVMLNPSTADASKDDPTIRRCIDFSNTLGFGGIYVVNLFALRATDPVKLRQVADPVGPDNDTWLKKAFYESENVIFAWGNNGVHNGRATQVENLASYCGLNPFEFGQTSIGQPKHPLYLAKSSVLRRRYPF